MRKAAVIFYCFWSVKYKSLFPLQAFALARGKMKHNQKQVECK